jgi:hypothetical protein
VGNTLLDKTQEMVKSEVIDEDELITFRGEHNISGLIPFEAVPIAKNGFTNSFEASSTTEFLAGAFIVGEGLYIRRDGILFKFVGFLPHQSGRLFSHLTPDERAVVNLKEEPRNDLAAQFQNCQNPKEVLFVSVEVKNPRAPRDLVRHMANCTVTGAKARVMVLSDLSNIPPHPAHRLEPEALQAKVYEARSGLIKPSVEAEDLFFFFLLF